jgi:hypothetical protein
MERTDLTLSTDIITIKAGLLLYRRQKEGALVLLVSNSQPVNGRQRFTSAFTTASPRSRSEPDKYTL